MTVQLRELRVSADFDASRYSKGMATKVAADQAGAASSRAVGAAVTETSSKVALSADPLERLSRQYISGYRDSQTFERALRTLSRGIDTGNVSMDRAGAILDGLYAKYGRMADAAEFATRGQLQLADAIDTANARYAQQGGQQRVMNGGQFNTGNIAAQLFDVGVTAPFMPAWQVGLQQGSQLSQAFSGQTLKQSIAGVGSALVSLVNPVSMLTIGFTTLTAVGIQTFMSLKHESENASEFLERHSAALASAVAGYDAAEAAVAAFVATASRMPSSVAANQLNGQFAQIDAEIEQFRERAGFVGSVFDGIGSAAERELSRLSAQFAAGSISAEELYLGLDTVRSSLNGLEQSFAGFSIQGLINEMEQGALKTIQFGNAINNLIAQSHALAGLSVDEALAGFFGQNSVEGALKAMQGLTPELRTQQQILDDIYQKALTNPTLTADGRAELSAGHQAASIALATQRQRQDAMRASQTGQQSLNQWQSANDNFRQRLGQTELEMRLLGRSTYEVERQKAAFDLLNQAKSAGIPITTEVIAQINAMAVEHGALQSQMEQVREAQQRQAETMEFYRGVNRGFFTDLKQELMNGVSLWDAFANAGANALNRIADRALGMAADGIFDLLIGAIGGAIGGGFGTIGVGGVGIPAGGFVPGLTGPRLFARGTNAAPTGFAWVGEEGPELVRFRGGEQVYDSRRSMQMAANQNFTTGNAPVVVQVIDQRVRGAPVQEQRSTGPDGEDIIRLIVRDEVNEARRRGAAGF